MNFHEGDSVTHWVFGLGRVIRRLASFRKARPLNDNDQSVLRRAEKALISEGGMALSLSPFEAESGLRDLLSKV